MSTTENRLPVKLLALVGVAAILVAAAGYTYTGAPQLALNPPQPASQDPGVQQIAEMVDTLAQRLKDKPDDAEGWAMLGRSYMVMGRLSDAVPAFRQSIKLRPNDANVLAEAAMALASAQNGVNEESDSLLQQALKLEPDNLRALSLAGSAAFDRQDYATAVKHWERIVAVSPPGGDFLSQVQAGIDEARQRAGMPAAQPATPPVAAASAAISGRVTLAAALKAQAAPEDTVFIFARAAEGPRVPLAILRKQVKDLPFDFVLDDGSAMSPATRLSTATGAVLVGARISKSGNAMPQPGDLAGQAAGPVALGATGVAIEISRAVELPAR